MDSRRLPPMDPARIAALLEPFLDAPHGQRLAAVDLDKISTYIDLLLRWNARINLTAIRDPEKIVPRHFGESFFLARHLFPERSASPEPRAQRGNPQGSPVAARNLHPRSTPGQSPTANHQPPITVIDLGSGAGFPALPIKIWTPEIRLTLIEANHKKAAFLREVVRSLTLINVDVIAERAEAVLACLTSASRPADIVTFRAVEKFDTILPLAARFLAPNGRLALLIGSAQQARLSAVPGLTWHLESIQQSHSRMLAIGGRCQSGITS